ncbi:MAG TPA: hypothetical protein VH478_14655 [Trebonia sp.]|jgi:DnaK suppressor protein|nr:hypothetical protein [Trebonia sp.]
MDEARARKLLQEERAEVARLLRGAEEAAEEDLAQDDGPQDYGDAAEPLSAEGEDENVAGTLRERLEAIDRALERLDDGTYGRSVHSGQPIPGDRLEADPAADLTIEEARARR